jgi:uroporphyrin-III C-methyltransferase
MLNLDATVDATTRPLKKIALVGAGPGSVDLITLRGLRYLQAAQVILTDALVDIGFRNLTPNATWIEVGKRGVKNLLIDGKDFKSCPQERIDRQLLLFAQCGFNVVRLKGGDPSLFARAEEEIAALQNGGFDFEIVPGVTSALAAAADAKTPLTRRGRGRSVSLQTAFSRDDTVSSNNGTQLCNFDSPQIAPTLVLYMAGEQLAQLHHPLHSAGWSMDTPVRLVSNAGSTRPLISAGLVSDLANLAAHHSGMPTITIIGVGAQEIVSVSKAQILPPQRLIAH